MRPGIHVLAAAAALAAGGAALAAAPGSAAKPPAAHVRSSAGTRTQVYVTAYNQNLALVREVRDLSGLPSGVFDLWFEDVPEQINPRTVALRGASQGAGALTVLEQNYEFDLVSPERLMEKSVGSTLDLVETGQDLQERTTHARLLSTNGGPVYEIGGAVSLGHPGRVVLPTLPGGLFARPTLVWKLENGGPAAQSVEVSYLTDGISWSADYVAIADAASSMFDLSGWVTLENRSGASFEDARLKLVAGDVQRAQARGEMDLMPGVTMKAQAAFESQNFFEYHLYALERPTDIRQNQSKQIQLFTAADVPVRKRYIVEQGGPWFWSGRVSGGAAQVPVGVFFETRNSKDRNLGMPLPAGTVRVYQRDKDGALQFAGEDVVKHTPKDETVTLRLGSAFDVVAEKLQTDWKRINVLPYDAESGVEVRLRNHKDEAITVTVRETMPAAEWKFLEQSHEGRKVSASQVEFEVPVPANGETVLRYRVALKS